MVTSDAPAISAAPLVALAAEPSPVAPPTNGALSLEVTFERELDAPVTAIALEKSPHAAALGRDEVWVHGASGWTSKPLPRAVRGRTRETLAIFFGRDYRVRVVGSEGDEPGHHGVYLRLLDAGFEAARTEIGRLGTLESELVAVLGTDDPEIVCRPGDICIVKSRKGWRTIAAPESLRLVALGGGAGFALGGRQLSKLDVEWTAIGAPGSWAQADFLFAVEDTAWVVETAASRIHVLRGGAWRVEPSPIHHPIALWGSAHDTLWLVGEEGLSFFDGKSWKSASHAPKNLKTVLGRGADDVWVGGDSGLFRVRRGD